LNGSSSYVVESIVVAKVASSPLSTFTTRPVVVQKSSTFTSSVLDGRNTFAVAAESGKNRRPQVRSTFRDAGVSESSRSGFSLESVMPRYAFSSSRLAYVAGGGLAASTDSGTVTSTTAPDAVQYQNQTPGVDRVNDAS